LISEVLKLMKKEKGFSLVETIVVMLVFLIVVGSIYGILQVGLIDRNRANRETELLKNARVALHLIGRDALNAGLGYTRTGAVVPGGFLRRILSLPPNTMNRDLLTAIIAGNDIFTNNLDPSVRTDLVAFAFRDVNFNGNVPISINDVGTSGGDIILHFQSNSPTDLSPGDLLLIQSATTQVAAMVTSIDNSSKRIILSPGDPLGINLPANGTGSNANILRPCSSSTDTNCTNYPGVTAVRFFWIAYKVKQDGTLVRIMVGNNRGGGTNQVQEMPIAYNVKDMQITYLINNGTVSDNPAAGADGVYGNADDTPLDMNRVIQINISIRVRSPEMDEKLRINKEFTIDASFSTRNVTYDA